MTMRLTRLMRFMIGPVDFGVLLCWAMSLCISSSCVHCLRCSLAAMASHAQAKEEAIAALERYDAGRGALGDLAQPAQPTLLQLMHLPLLARTRLLETLMGQGELSVD
ncbi:unnamed protein product [Durusdinium trenchii]|uniref:Uncharacterized protein n=1 Tax=Durusdinium trenchii TaxID=1381693 RepID=A0ABP0Q1J2_9DINO